MAPGIRDRHRRAPAHDRLFVRYQRGLGDVHEAARIPAALSSMGHRVDRRWWKNAWGSTGFTTGSSCVPSLRCRACFAATRSIEWRRAGFHCAGAGRLAVLTQTGGLRYYAAVVGLGVCVLIAVMALR
jgi:hypothetical protein